MAVLDDDCNPVCFWTCGIVLELSDFGNLLDGVWNREYNIGNLKCSIQPVVFEPTFTLNGIPTLSVRCRAKVTAFAGERKLRWMAGD